MNQNSFKKYLGIFFLSILFSFSSFSQKTKATIYLTNGESIEGYGSLTGKSKIKFKKAKEEKPTIYRYGEVDSIRIYSNDELNTYVIQKIKGKKKTKTLEQLVVGKINLYRTVHYGNSPRFTQGGNYNTGGSIFGLGSSFTIKNFYVRRANEKEATYLGSTHLFSKSFKKASSEYFKDCPVLVDKIEKGEYKKRDLRAIIEFYNNSCESK